MATVAGGRVAGGGRGQGGRRWGWLTAMLTGHTVFFFSYFFLIFNIFNWTNMWGLCPTQQITLFFATSALTGGSTCQFPCQFEINPKSVHIANNYPKSCDFFRLKHKIVVFHNLASNIAVLC
jgi:hypothetical protein